MLHGPLPISPEECMMQRLACAVCAALALAGCNNAADVTRSAVGPDGDVLLEVKTPIQTGDLPPLRGPNAAAQVTTQGATSGAPAAGTLSGGAMEAASAGSSGRNPRGSGIEGVSSGNTQTT